MSTPAYDNESLRDLELDVRMELTPGRISQPEQEADGPPVAGELPHPDAERYEVALRTLLGAIESVEDGSRPKP